MPLSIIYPYGYGMDFSTNITLVLVIIFVSIFISFAYHVYFVGEKGATPGKMVMKLKVIGTDGRMPIGYGTALTRSFAEIISGAVFGLGYIWIIFDDEKQGWHDKLANTFVVKE